MEANRFYVGQKVRVYNNNGSEWIKTVEKITPTGRVKVGNIYYVDGVEYTSCTWGKTTYIEPATDEIIKRFQQKRFIRNVLKALRNIDTMTYEDAVKVNNILHVAKGIKENEN